jgi:hypothetical protein
LCSSLQRKGWEGRSTSWRRGGLGMSMMCEDQHSCVLDCWRVNPLHHLHMLSFCRPPPAYLLLISCLSAPWGSPLHAPPHALQYSQGCCCHQWAACVALTAPWDHCNTARAHHGRCEPSPGVCVYCCPLPAPWPLLCQLALMTDDWLACHGRVRGRGQAEGRQRAARLITIMTRAHTVLLSMITGMHCSA